MTRTMPYRLSDLMQHTRICMILCPCLFACDSFGQPLVDEWPALPPGEGPPCDPTPGCEPPPDLPTTHGFEGVVQPVTTPCDREVSPAAWPMVECGSLRLLAGEDHGALDVSDGELARVNLTLESTRPSTLTLRSTRMSDVFIRLRGPITLRFIEGCVLDDVRIVGDTDAAGSPSVEMTDVQAQRLAVTGSDGRLEGSFVASHATVLRGRIQASDVRLDSVRCNAVHMDAMRLTAADTSFVRLELRVGVGLLASSRMNHARVLECGALTLISNLVINTQFKPCTQLPLRLYDGTIATSLLDGRIEVDSAHLEEVKLGVLEDTELMSWDSHIILSSFCARSVTTHLGGEAHLDCPDCLEAAAPDSLFCGLPEAELGIAKPYACEVLFDPPPTCNEPHPERLRPQRVDAVDSNR